MGSRGPAPASKKKLSARGSRRAKGRPDDLELEVKIPKPPTTLDKEAKAEWNRLMKILGPKQVVSEGDRAAMVLLCEMWSEDRKYAKQILKLEKADMIGDIAYKRMANMRNDVRKQIVPLLAKFGLTPADRTRVKVGDDGKGATNGGNDRFFKPKAKEDFKPRLVS